MKTIKEEVKDNAHDFYAMQKNMIDIDKAIEIFLGFYINHNRSIRLTEVDNLRRYLKDTLRSGYIDKDAFQINKEINDMVQNQTIGRALRTVLGDPKPVFEANGWCYDVDDAPLDKPLDLLVEIDDGTDHIKAWRERMGLKNGEIRHEKD